MKVSQVGKMVELTVFFQQTMFDDTRESSTIGGYPIIIDHY
jgi:hypothetical protein